MSWVGRLLRGLLLTQAQLTPQRNVYPSLLLHTRTRSVPDLLKMVSFCQLVRLRYPKMQVWITAPKARLELLEIFQKDTFNAVYSSAKSAPEVGCVAYADAPSLLGLEWLSLSRYRAEAFLFCENSPEATCELLTYPELGNPLDVRLMSLLGALGMPQNMPRLPLAVFPRKAEVEDEMLEWSESVTRKANFIGVQCASLEAGLLKETELLKLCAKIYARFDAVLVLFQDSPLERDELFLEWMAERLRSAGVPAYHLARATLAEKISALRRFKAFVGLEGPLSHVAAHLEIPSFVLTPTPPQEIQSITPMPTEVYTPKESSGLNYERLWQAMYDSGLGAETERRITIQFRALP